LSFESGDGQPTRFCMDLPLDTAEPPPGIVE
jgi:hypothetical protein